MKTMTRLGIFCFSIIVFQIFLTFQVSGQGKIPQGINYQAVARDENGYPVADKDIVVEISIISETINGSIVWQEVHYPKTNSFGMFTVVIGEGTSTFNGNMTSFSKIKWSNSDYYMRVRVDFGEEVYGNGLVDMGTLKLQAVPYALIADSVLKAPMPKMQMKDLIDVDVTGLLNNQVLMWNGTKWVPTGSLSGNYITIDGKTDLTGDWTISQNNITLQNGTLTTKNLSITDGFQMQSSPKIIGVSTDILLGSALPSDYVLSTQKAIKSYIDNSPGPEGNWTLQSGSLYPTQITNFVGIGTTTPLDKFHADIGSNGFLVTGSYNGGSIAITKSGPGARMAFYPGKAAFRAGNLEEGGTSTTWWDDANVGLYSVAMGRDTKAFGKYSVSLGQFNEALGDKSFAMGYGNRVTGIVATAFGQQNDLAGAYSAALGFNNKTLGAGSSSIALGYGNETNGEASIGMGYQTKTYGKYSHTYGYKTQTNAAAEASFAGGSSTTAFGKYSFALGSGLNANSYAEFVVGQYNTNYQVAANGQTQWNTTDRLFVIGNGTAAATTSDAMVVLKNGYVGLGTNQPSSTLHVIGNVYATGSVTQNSDLKFKREIVPIGNALEKALKMRGVYYNWKRAEFPQNKFTDRRQIGLIAQEVETLFPELVETDLNGNKSVDYSKVTSVLIEAIKEQQNTIEQLKTTNLSNEQRINALNAKLDEVSKKMSVIEGLLKK
jgi:hypothetical protein